MIQVIDIAKVADISGIPASTLRFYEEKGLITSIGRRGLRRLFGAEVLQRLSLITLAQKAGFSLDEIATICTSHGVRIDRNKLSAKAEELDRTIKQLMAMRNGLRHAAKCPARNHMECPTFQRLLKISDKKGKKNIPKRQKTRAIKR